MEKVMNNNETKKEYITSDVLKALKNMDSQYGEILINAIKVGEITALMNDKEALKNYIKEFDDYIAKVKMFTCSLRLLEKELLSTKDDNKDILDIFKSMDKESKRKLSVDLYNNKEFQSNLSGIVLDVINQNAPEAINFLKTLGVDFDKYLEQFLSDMHIRNIYQRKS